jgi:glucose/arabinose dehydrogenase
LPRGRAAKHHGHFVGDDAFSLRRREMTARTILLPLLLLALAACGERARLSVAEGIGPAPRLPPPVRTAIPTVKVAKATGWPAGASPVAAPGLAVAAFATGLDHPRWLTVLPNGDVLVAETSGPVRPKDGRGIKGFFFKLFQKKAGSAVPSADRISLLRDSDADGVAETRTIFFSGLHSPFGMALAGETLFVANTTRRRRRARPGLRARRLCRPARLVEPQPAERLQGDLRPLLRRQAIGGAGRRADRLPQRRRQGDGTAGRGGDRPGRRPAGG